MDKGTDMFVKLILNYVALITNKFEKPFRTMLQILMIEQVVVWIIDYVRMYGKKWRKRWDLKKTAFTAIQGISICSYNHRAFSVLGETGRDCLCPGLPIKGILLKFLLIQIGKFTGTATGTQIIWHQHISY